ncbi:MAG: DUF3768 domain-containing protein [Vampirovibrionales bacterium]|nr:DUF3768 domain-containing protein [Vampirovibrionales bacterium]
MTKTTTKIATLNDTLRTTFIGGKTLLTHGIQSLDQTVQAEVIGKVRMFNDFSKDNDPHGEHDFGSFKHAGQKIFWKIDYYDPTLTYGSEDPANPEITTRVLTIMLAEEY